MNTSSIAQRQLAPRRGRLAVAVLVGTVLAALVGGLPPAAPAEASITPARSTAVTPDGIAADAAGNLYIADHAGHVVHKVTPDGDISVVAGTGMPLSPVEGPATSSPLVNPSGVAVTPDGGTLYIADRGSNTLLRVRDDVLSIVAGTPARDDEAGPPPRPGPALQSGLLAPAGLALDAAGNLLVADSWHATVERIAFDADGVGTLSIVAGTPLVWGPPTEGPAIWSRLFLPLGVAAHTNGTTYIAATGHNLVLRVTPDGELSVVAGHGSGRPEAPTEGRAEWSGLGDITGLAVDGDDLYVADPTNHRVLRIDLATGRLHFFAGTGEDGDPVDGAGALASPLRGPTAVAVDGNGNVYISDTAANLVLQVSDDGVLRIVAGTGEGSGGRLDVAVGIADRPPVPEPGQVWTPTVVTLSDGAVSLTSQTPEVCTVDAAPPPTPQDGPVPDGVDISDPFTDGPLPALVELVAEGECILVPSVGETSRFTAVTGEPQSFAVGDLQVTPRKPEITNIPLPATRGGSFVATVFSQDSIGAPVVTSSTPAVCSVAGMRVSFARDGTCTLTASVPETTEYTARTGDPQSFTVVATDAPGVEVTTPPTLPAATLGVDYTAQLASSGGPDATWSLVDGEPAPAGLELSDTGELAFVPAVPGTATVQVQVQDGGDIATAELSIPVEGCGTPVTGTSKKLTLSAGTTCLVGATVKGPLKAPAGAVVAIGPGTTITGPVDLRGARTVSVCGATLGGPLKVRRTAGPVVVGGPGCDASSIKGPVELTETAGPVVLTDATVDGPAKLGKTTGSVTVTDNQLKGPMTVARNSGPVRVSGNTVSKHVTVRDNVTSDDPPSAPMISGNSVGGKLACQGNAPAPVAVGPLNAASKVQGQCVQLVE